jgi:hypothetical protein
MFPPSNSNPDNPQDIQRWMEDTANSRPTNKRVIFDKRLKRLVAVPISDPHADDSLEFTPKEAQRF